MFTRTVRVRATREEVVNAVSHLTRAVRAPGAVQAALLTRLGMTLLGRISKAFVMKARGGTDEAGLKWQPLAPSTVAYKRRHPVLSRSGRRTGKYLPRSRERASFAPSYQLTSGQRSLWWGLYRNYLAKFAGDRAHAAAASWLVLKSRGARTLLEVYGHARVEILRDTGLLLNTLTPGVAGARVEGQVFRVAPGEVTVGTSRAWAWAHHSGAPGRLPRRPLWPEPSAWPSSWWLDLLGQAARGAADLLVYILGGAA